MNTVGSARRKEAIHALNPFAPGAGRQPKELVGREQELEIMDRIIARTKAGYSDRGLVYSVCVQLVVAGLVTMIFRV